MSKGKVNYFNVPMTGYFSLLIKSKVCHLSSGGFGRIPAGWKSLSNVSIAAKESEMPKSGQQVVSLSNPLEPWRYFHLLF